MFVALPACCLGCSPSVGPPPPRCIKTELYSSPLEVPTHCFIFRPSPAVNVLGPTSDAARAGMIHWSELIQRNKSTESKLS